MDRQDTPAVVEPGQPGLDFTSLLGAGRAFDPAGAGPRQTALIDASCNRVGNEGPPAPPPPPPPP